MATRTSANDQVDGLFYRTVVTRKPVYPAEFEQPASVSRNHSVDRNERSITFAYARPPDGQECSLSMVGITSSDARLMCPSPPAPVYPEDAWTGFQSCAIVSYVPRSPAAYRKLASRVLSERGIAAVWQLHLDAVAAHFGGFPGAAALLLAIADAAEDLVWWQTQVTEAARGDP
jgi:hypothetical protein